MWRLLFLIIPLSALAYTLWHVWTLLPLPSAWRTAAVVLCAGAFCMLFLSIGKVLDAMPMTVATTVYRVGTTSMIILLYAFIFFLILDLLRLVRVIPAQVLHGNWLTLAALVAVLLVLTVCGNIHYHHKKRQEITLTTDKAVRPGTKLLLASDLHLGYHIRRNELRQWVDMINAERPDIVLLGGDLVDRGIRPLIEEDMAAELRRINAPVFACFGNHEYYCGAFRAEAFYRSAGITLLRDSTASFGGMCIAGRDDRTNSRRESVKSLLRNVPRDKFIILLDHQPYNLRRAAEAGVDFQFSGHTHHGQVFPASLITDAVYTVAHGKYTDGKTQYYVSSGLGIWGAKFRIGTCSEYVVATIVNN
ncbi:MAG: metallophosphoesterase [Prevotella sp.]|nr:metallophosphoesterase [Prevotella sp.]